MPTVIDTLIVKLGLDTAAYKAGVDEASATGKALANDQGASADKAAQAVAKAAQKASADQEKAAKRAASEAEKAAKKAAAEQVRAAKAAGAEAKKLERQYEKVRNEILGMTAAAFGASAIKDFFTSVVGGQSRLLQTSKDFSLSARELDAWHQSAKQALGGTAEGFDKSVQSILGGIEAFKAGDVSNTVVASLQQLGVKVTDASGRMRPMKDVLLDLSAAFQKMPNRQDQIVWAGRLGIDEGTLNMLRQGRGALSALYDESYRNSAVSEASAKQADETRRAWARLATTWDNVKNTLFQDLTPAIGGLNTALGGLNTFMQAHPDLTAGLFGTLMAASTLGGIMKLTGALGGLKTVLGGVGRMLGLGGAAGGAAAAEGAATAAAGGGLASTLGIAGLAAYGGLQVAKAAGLPDVDRRKAAEDIRKGNWWTASAEMNPLDLMRALTARSGGRTNEQIAAAIAKGANPLETAAKAQDKAAQSQLDGAKAASQALIDAAQDLAGAVSTNAAAAELPAGAGAAPGSVVTGSAKSAAAAFMKMGWSREQAAGIAANLNIESGLRPNIVGDRGAAYGIGQWHADRQAEFRRVFGHDIRGSSLEEQLQFVNYELTRGQEQAAGRALRGARSAGEAGAIVSAKYERPLNVEKEIGKRSAAASALYASLPGGVGTAGGGAAVPAGLPTAAPMMTAAYQAGAGASMVNSHNRTDTHIGTVNVYGSDTNDGHAVVADMRDELDRHGLIAGAAYGMS